MSTPNRPVTVIGLHAFTRGPAHLDALGQACRAHGWGWLSPALAPRLLPVLMNSRRHLRRIARSLAADVGDGADVVLVGHSAGAAAACPLAVDLTGRGVQVLGIVMVDGADSPNRLIERTLPDLRAVPIVGVLAPPNPCNRQGRLAGLLDRERPGSTLVIPGSGHGDIEMRDSRVYRSACGDTSDPATRQSVLEHTLAAIAAMVSGEQITHRPSVS